MSYLTCLHQCCVTNVMVQRLTLWLYMERTEGGRIQREGHQLGSFTEPPVLDTDGCDSPEPTSLPNRTPSVTQLPVYPPLRGQLQEKLTQVYFYSKASLLPCHCLVHQSSCKPMRNWQYSGHKNWFRDRYGTPSKPMKHKVIPPRCFQEKHTLQDAGWVGAYSSKW